MLLSLQHIGQSLQQLRVCAGDLTRDQALQLIKVGSSANAKLQTLTLDGASRPLLHVLTSWIKTLRGTLTSITLNVRAASLLEKPPPKYGRVPQR